jgi:hypothetical protein
MKFQENWLLSVEHFGAIILNRLHEKTEKSDDASGFV